MAEALPHDDNNNSNELEPDEGQDDLAWVEEDLEDEEEEGQDEDEADNEKRDGVCSKSRKGGTLGAGLEGDAGGGGQFSFATNVCAMCDGYYGPNFGQVLLIILLFNYFF